MCSVAVVRCHRPNAQQLKIGSGPHSLSLTSVSCALRLQQCLGGDSFRFLGLVQPSPLILEGLERLVNLVSIKVGRLVVVHVLAPTHDSDIKFRVSLVCVLPHPRTLLRDSPAAPEAVRRCEARVGEMAAPRRDERP